MVEGRLGPGSVCLLFARPRGHSGGSLGGASGGFWTRSDDVFPRVFPYPLQTLTCLKASPLTLIHMLGFAVQGLKAACLPVVTLRL